MASSEVDRAFKERDFTSLIEFAESGAPEQRAVALGYLGTLRRRHVAEAVGHILMNDEHEPVRVTAARVLASLGGDVAVNMLLETDARTPLTRAKVAEALGILGDPAAEPRLASMLADADARVRAAAAEALGRVRAPRSVDALARLVDDESGVVRKRARRALIEIGTPLSVGALGAKRRGRWLSRLLNVRAAQQSLARHERRARGEVKGALDRLTVRLWAGAFKALIVAAALGVADVFLLGAPPAIVAALALVVGIGFSFLVLLAADPLLDMALARAERRTATMPLAPSSLTVARVLARKPVHMAAFVAVPLGADALLGAPGALPGLVAGLALGSAAQRAWQGVGVWTCGDEAAQRLRVETDAASILSSRFFK